jgi:hypothetical protein
MKTIILSTVIAFLIASPVHAVPITWIFRGTTGSNSEFPGPPSVPIKEGLGFEMRILLDTTTLGEPLGGGLAEVSFGSALAVIDIETFSSLPMHFGLVEYFVTNGAVTGIVLNEPFSAIAFDSSLTTETIVLRPIAPTEPTADNLLDEIVGPNNLFSLRDTKVATFSAVRGVSEGGSTTLFLTSALVALGLLRWRYKGSAS